LEASKIREDSRWRDRDYAKCVQIFGSVASSRSRLHGAMRNPRQPRCTAAKHGRPPGEPLDRRRKSAFGGVPTTADRPVARSLWLAPA